MRVFIASTEPSYLNVSGTFKSQLSTAESILASTEMLETRSRSVLCGCLRKHDIKSISNDKFYLGFGCWSAKTFTFIET